ncbi:type IX secretion system protein PorD [Mucilaginibacter paludis]|uniref:DUF4835 domain-containing protein n=1 Tax=Mucilaginibacter paludis DSM 18603 TaxID=714943 RepID=H1Y044_9SPHI|nr:DUF4835 family protein [Mucilaginibacter paludis]EHQ27953.1 hypothetical protein Mucpa_3859 [Mucilaginibacter paludis DSM 18603]
MKKLVTCIVILLILANLVAAQDLNARVQVLSPKIQTSNKRIFQVLENAIKDFLNNRKWSADQILPQERIDCNLVLNITAWDGSSKYSGELQVQSTRPIYGSTYNSTLLTVNDKDFDWTYTEGQLLDYNDQTFQSNLTSVLAYYAYVIIGMDYDSFSKYAGTPYFAKAQTIVNAAQSASYKGWNAFDNSHNRYWLAENLNNKRYLIIREFNYNYHRNGLDLMADNPANARKAIAALLPDLSQIDRQSLGTMLPQLFFTAKSDEFVSVFSVADPQTKMKVYNILNGADPSNGNKYQALQKN